MSLYATELSHFLALKHQFLTTHNAIATDPHGFTTVKHNPDILITGLTHGNEVIGLQIINLLLEKIMAATTQATTTTTPYSFAILLNNVKAYDKNERFIDKDLNRSFYVGKTDYTLHGTAKTTAPHSSQTSDFYEFHRAREIEEIIKKLKPKLIIDLHQTVEPTLSPFFILPEDQRLIQMAHTFTSDWPIITFDPSGFSKDGQTLMEFAKAHEVPAFVIEISQNGFDLSLAADMCNRLFNLNIKKLLANNTPSVHKTTEKIPYYKITHHLTKEIVDTELIPGFKSLQPIEKNELLGYAASGDKYLSPTSGLMIFPKYGKLAEKSHELGLIATLVR